MMKQTAIIFILSLVYSLSLRAGGIWSPKPNFTIEGSDYIETLTFIAGMSYALDYSNQKLIAIGSKNFYCLNNNELVTSKLILELLNEELQGDHTSEEVTATLIEQLEVQFPCAN